MLGLGAAAPVLAVVSTFTTRSFRVDRFVRPAPCTRTNNLRLTERVNRVGGGLVPGGCLRVHCAGVLAEPVLTVERDAVSLQRQEPCRGARMGHRLGVLLPEVAVDALEALCLRLRSEAGGLGRGERRGAARVGERGGEGHGRDRQARNLREERHLGSLRLVTAVCGRCENESPPTRLRRHKEPVKAREVTHPVRERTPGVELGQLVEQQVAALGQCSRMSPVQLFGWVLGRRFLSARGSLQVLGARAAEG
jgi:hypothetical protein